MGLLGSGVLGLLVGVLRLSSEGGLLRVLAILIEWGLLGRELVGLSVLV